MLQRPGGVDIVESRSALIFITVALALLQRFNHRTRKTYVSHLTGQIERVLTANGTLEAEDWPTRPTDGEQITFFNALGTRVMFTIAANATFWSSRIADDTLHLSVCR